MEDNVSIERQPTTDELLTTFRHYILAVPEPQDRARIEKALLLSIDIHQGQLRGHEPYIDHVLQVAIRIAKNMPTFPDRIIAALFHDGPEDQAERLAQLTIERQRETIRERAFRALEEMYGADVRRIVEGMTNLETIDGLPADEKNSRYAEHVITAIQDDDVLWTKLSDVYENAVKVHLNTNLKHRLRLSKKYVLIMQPFIDRLTTIESTDLPQAKMERAIARLQWVQQSMQEFIAQQEAAAS